MILTEHNLTIQAKCPVNGNTDTYRVTVTTTRLIAVEEILSEVDRLTDIPIFQERLTGDLAASLFARVKTVGAHSGVETTCVAGEE